MKPEELRIGNYVNIDCHNMVVSTVGDIGNPEMGNKGMWYLCDEGYDYAEYEDVYPIPLTEQWMKDFGFKKSEKTSWDWVNKEVRVETIDEPYHFSYDDPINRGDYKTTSLKYVHQLQNLYYALTGEELTKIKADVKNPG